MTVVTPSGPATDVATRAGVRATYAAFIATGFIFASWASRIPQVRDRLGLTPAQVGLVLLAIAAGSLVALPLSGGIVHRFGSRRTVALLSVLDGVAMTLVAVGYRIGVVPVVIGLAIFGFAQGGWDVAMNVQGAIVEQRLGRSIMPRFHAGFSVGTVAGAGLGAAAVALHIPVTAHLLVVGALIAALVPFGVRGFVPDHGIGALAAATGFPVSAQLLLTAVAVVAVVAVAVRSFLPVAHEVADGARPRARDAWRDRRTVLIGLFVLAFALTEGVANDWIALALVDGHGTSESLGAIGYGVFVAAMTLGRLTGGSALQRFGRVPTLRAAAAVALVGLLLVVFGGPLPLVLAGAALWGVGAALGFPLGMSAAADDPVRAASRVAVVSSIGYTAFLAGPPLIGLLAQASDILQALLVIVVALAVGFALAGSTREPAAA